MKLKKKVKKDSNFKKSVDMVLKRGNIWALAIGVLIGAAFGAVINSLANDIIMQAIAKRAGVQGVESLSVGTTRWEQIADPDHAGKFLQGKPLDGIMYGKFLSAVFAFFIIAACLILFTYIGYSIWRGINRKKIRAAEAASAAQANAPIAPDTQEQILIELKKLNENFTKRPAAKAKTSTAKKPAAKAKKATAKKSVKKSTKK